MFIGLKRGVLTDLCAAAMVADALIESWISCGKRIFQLGI
jgi:hypothetical protein